MDISPARCATRCPRAGNVQLLDWQPNGRVSLADALSIIHFLFLNGPPHHLAVPGAEGTGCVTIEGCPDNPLCEI